MNQEVRNIIINVTRSPTVLACLQLAELVEVEDFSGFSQHSIDILEKYIQSRTSIMDLDSRKMYLTEEYFYYPDKFMFTPGIRNRLLKAAKHIYKSAYSNVYGSNRSDTADSHMLSSDTNHRSTNHEQIANIVAITNPPFAFSSPSTENQFLSSPCAIKTEPLDQIRHIDYIEKYGSDISKNANKNFDKCSLEPGIHFVITIPEDDASNLVGLFHCLICADRRKSVTVIKFRFSRYNSVIYTNINSHLKTHFQYLLDNSERKRARLSKTGTLDTALLDDVVNNICGNDVEFEL